MQQKEIQERKKDAVLEDTHGERERDRFPNYDGEHGAVQE